MKRPGFTEGIIIACVLSLAGRFLFDVFAWLLTPRTAVLALTITLCLAYFVYLLARSRVLTGRVTMLTAWVVFTAMTWTLQAPVTVFILVQVGMLWLLRSMYFYNSISSALFDLVLVVTGTITGAWAMAQTQGPAAGVWCFLLVQSLFITIPAGWQVNPARQPRQDRFEYAWRCARSAVEKLAAGQRPPVT